MIFLSLNDNRDDTPIAFMNTLVKEAYIAEVDKLTREALILHAFFHPTLVTQKHPRRPELLLWLT